LAHLGVVHKIIGSGTDINGNAQKEAWEKMMAYSFLEQQHFHSSRINILKIGRSSSDAMHMIRIAARSIQTSPNKTTMIKKSDTETSNKTDAMTDE